MTVDVVQMMMPLWQHISGVKSKQNESRFLMVHYGDAGDDGPGLLLNAVD